MISEENFMKGASKWLSMLKLRASYGQTGNSNVGYRIYDYYEVGRNAIIGGAESTGAVSYTHLLNFNTIFVLSFNITDK